MDCSRPDRDGASHWRESPVPPRIHLEHERLGSPHSHLPGLGEDCGEFVPGCGLGPEYRSHQCRREAEEGKRYDDLQQRKPAGGC